MKKSHILRSKWRVLSNLLGMRRTGVCKTRTGFLRTEKNADNKKSKTQKARNADGKKKIKQSNKRLRKEIFFSSRCHMVGPFTYIQKVMPIVGTVILYPVIPFINVTEIRTLRSSSLNARIPGALLLWVFSLRLAGKVNSSKNRLAKEVCAKRGLDTCGWPMRMGKWR